MSKMKTRMAWLSGFALVAVPLLSACGDAATPTVPPAATTGTGTSDVNPDMQAALDALAGEGIKPDTAASGNFEFFSWWTAGGEADGKNDLLNLYKALYPNVNVIDAAVAGGGGDVAKGVLKNRMQGNDPPDAFQVHGGPELIDGYVKADKMELDHQALH